MMRNALFMLLLGWRDCQNVNSVREINRGEGR